MFGVLGKMLAFEACFAGGLWLLGKAAPELKQQAADAAKAKLQEIDPELVQQFAQLSQRAQ